VFFCSKYTRAMTFENFCLSLPRLGSPRYLDACVCVCVCARARAQRVCGCVRVGYSGSCQYAGVRIRLKTSLTSARAKQV